MQSGRWRVAGRGGLGDVRRRRGGQWRGAARRPALLRCGSQGQARAPRRARGHDARRGGAEVGSASGGRKWGGGGGRALGVELCSASCCACKEMREGEGKIKEKEKRRKRKKGKEKQGKRKGGGASAEFAATVASAGSSTRHGTWVEEKRKDGG
jgi:hypothetical protein